MQTQKTHYTRSYNVWHENALHLMYSIDMKDTLHSDIQYEFWEECTAFEHTVRIFKRILYSDV